MTQVKKSPSPTLPDVTKELVRARLKTVVDPELDVDIVSLGLIYGVEVIKKPRGKIQIHLTMTLTTPGCPLAGTIDYMVRQTFADLPGFDVNKDIKLDLVFDPPWTQDMMSEEARLGLGM